eukprot:1655933-Prymnesium_polylepis.1
MGETGVATWRVPSAHRAWPALAKMTTSGGAMSCCATHSGDVVHAIAHVKHWLLGGLPAVRRAEVDDEHAGASGVGGVSQHCEQRAVSVMTL